jgi:hypothetical protein
VARASFTSAGKSILLGKRAFGRQLTLKINADDAIPNFFGARYKHDDVTYY